MTRNKEEIKRGARWVKMKLLLTQGEDVLHSCGGKGSQVEALTTSSPVVPADPTWFSASQSPSSRPP